MKIFCIVIGTSKSDEADQAVTAPSKEVREALPYRLRIALKYSVFHYANMNDVEKARSLATAAYAEGVKYLDQVEGGTRRIVKRSYGLWGTSNGRSCVEAALKLICFLHELVVSCLLQSKQDAIHQ